MESRNKETKHTELEKQIEELKQEVEKRKEVESLMHEGEEMQQKEGEKDIQLTTLQIFVSFQIPIFTEHSGRPSKKCELCRKAMDELSLMSPGLGENFGSEFTRLTSILKY